jgi:hypothetical protein
MAKVILRKGYILPSISVVVSALNKEYGDIRRACYDDGTLYLGTFGPIDKINNCILYESDRGCRFCGPIETVMRATYYDPEKSWEWILKNISGYGGFREDIVPLVEEEKDDEIVPAEWLPILGMPDSLYFPNSPCLSKKK